MIPLTLEQIADVTGGRVVDAPAEQLTVTGPAFVDSRRVEPGGLFVAVSGERVDGHDYAGQAVAAGAAAVLGERSTGVPTVVVPDPVVALGRLARHVVDRLRDAGGLTVLALTGSQGKTGTKDYLAQILGAAGRTVAPLGNANNEIGLPVTVLRADESTDYLVLEMGARGIGHIAYLCDIAPPDIATVINVGTAHLGEFGSREAIARAKGEIVEALPASGRAVLPTGDPVVEAMATRTVAPVLTFGAGADVGWDDVVLDDLDQATFDLRHGEVRARVRLTASGRHQVDNATAAAALALAAGVGIEQSAAVLSAAVPASRYRMERTERPDGTIVINDSYNASPASMRAAIDTLAEIGARRGARTVAVLGEMRELGADSESEHRALGVYLAERRVDELVTVGPLALPIHEAALATPGWSGSARHVESRATVVADVRHNGRAGDVILVKGARAAALESVGEALAHQDQEGISPT